MFFGDFFVLYAQSECAQVSACFCKPRLFVSNGRICSTANHGTQNQLTSVIDIELYSNKNKKK